MRFNPDIKPDFLRLTHNNEQAWQFVELFADRCHHLDDLVDKDKPTTDQDVIERELAWLMAIQGNSFWTGHSQFLMPLIIMSCNAWLDANEWEKSGDETKRSYANVIKSMYHEVIFAVVYICGGWKSLREFTSLHREYQKD